MTAPVRHMDEQLAQGVNGVLDPAEGRALFDRQARRLLNMSGADFLRRWEAGEYRDLPDTPQARKVMRVAYLIPFGREDA